MRLGLSGPWQELLGKVALLAQAQGANLWLVGGVVRDLLLGITLGRDLDLAVEGNPSSLAEKLATTLGGKVVAKHETFGTATVLLPFTSQTSLNLDLARTRTETYPSPGALPIVQPAQITADLARRDFSLNALAIPILRTEGKLYLGDLLDPFKGKEDLASKQLRVLHPQSFIDDPTRILRGLRLLARLGLKMEAQTQEFLALALTQRCFETVTSERIQTELCLTLEEPEPAKVLYFADKFGITAHIFAPLHWSEQLDVRMKHRMIDHPQKTLLTAGLLTYDLQVVEIEALIDRYRLPGEVARLLREVNKLKALNPRLAAPKVLRNSDLDHLLRTFSKVALEVISSAENSSLAGERIRYYLTQLREIKPTLDGRDLQALGIKPGPKLGQILAELRAARLDGLVETEAEERMWVAQKV